MEQTNFPQQPLQQYPPYYMMQKKKSRWWVPLIIILGSILLVAIIIIVIISSALSIFDKEPPSVKSNSVLYLNFTEGLAEYSQGNAFDIFNASGKASFFDMLTAIEVAKTDSKIKGIYIKASGAKIGFVKMQELGLALNDFKSSGKFIYAFIETGRESDYFNALPADSIFMPSEGMLELNGFGSEGLFMKGLLNKFGIEFYVQQFEDFKSAAESLNRTKFSDSARKQLYTLLNDRFNVFTNAISLARKMELPKVRNAINRGIYTADSLKELGFIDAISSESNVREFIKSHLKISESDKKSTKGKDDLRLVSIDTYVASGSLLQSKASQKDMRIAVIYGSGTIRSGKAKGAFDEQEIAADDYISYLRKARDDDKISAIILRLDSPGGSVIASDAIWEEIIKTKKIKPVYASMSDLAASGGYYIAMACDTIVAHPSTITGSIGVILAIPNFTGMLGKLDITVDTVSTSQSAFFLNPMLKFSAQDKAKLYNLSYSIYRRFVGRVAESRHKTFDETRALAKGRVWSGRDAFKLGLVDALGGFRDCIKIAKRRIGAPDSLKVKLEFYPKPQDKFEKLLRLFGMDSEGGEEETTTTWKKEFASRLGLSDKVFASQWELLPDALKSQAKYIYGLLEMSRKESVIAAMPYLIEEH
ncbi:MAG: Signal peptide peptidase SppA [Ignavibacteria bacterium]|nr:Signal peptide peptidase SppA [Ignavibacteria bacterium]